KAEGFHQLIRFSSLRGAKRRSNPLFARGSMDCFASLAMTESIELLAAEGRFKRPLRHDDVKGDVEGDEHRHGEDESGQQRFPPGDLADKIHEAGDQQKTYDIEAEILRSEAEQHGRHEHREHAAELRARDERFGCLLARQKSSTEAIEAGAGEDDGEIER